MRETVAKFECAIARAMVHIFGVEDGCTGTNGGLDDLSVPEVDAALLDVLEGHLDEGCVNPCERQVGRPSIAASSG